ncbi:ABC transporter substrate-binding protein [Arthrobacter sp. zg-Y1219]|uniref:ABC transporter substrate-binding protein n=1 Tax=Arthrobacter sp. zg-Y1219 TaxID=3049067 RepID=UPI0024C3C8F8|nr:ABC transporter substrate-binding protein [Arthrobacter sp. zg-Y1219]MDK1360648.1 ABC transporter substrate-binding protein [Arthrobacter sp. zg-Y1219]
MPQPVDVGSTLGGRYKVTAQVLSSAENDLVLDGVDQVLNRAVSILLAAPENTAQVSASAREVATGERASNVQILDLGVSDGRTYLVTNNANAADLLDLVIERDAPFVEPFFTDTLGSEIFGMPRSREPETTEDDRYVEEPAERAPRKPLMAGRPLPRLPKFGRAGAAAGAGGGVLSGAEEAAAARDLEFGDAADAPAEAATGAANMPPPSAARPTSGAAPATGPTPKVSRWTETDYASEADSVPEENPAAEEPAAPSAPARRAPGSGSERLPSNFPKSAVAATAAAEDDYEGYEDDDDDAAPGGRRTWGRVLVGAVLTLVLVVAVVLAVGQLGKQGNDAPQAADEPTAAASAPAEAPPAAAPVQTAAAPVPAGISRLVPGNPALDAENDGALPQILDGNPATYWSSYVYANDTFGGLAPNLALVVELEEESAINKIDISQLNGTGGSFSVLLNDSPSLEGASSVAESGFTGPTTSIQVPKVEGEAATAKYVIVNFTQLPRLSGGLQATYPWGLRIAEIGVS